MRGVEVLDLIGEIGDRKHERLRAPVGNHLLARELREAGLHRGLRRKDGRWNARAPGLELGRREDSARLASNLVAQDVRVAARDLRVAQGPRRKGGVARLLGGNGRARIWRRVALKLRLARGAPAGLLDLGGLLRPLLPLLLGRLLALALACFFLAGSSSLSLSRERFFWVVFPVFLAAFFVVRFLAPLSSARRSPRWTPALPSLLLSAACRYAPDRTDRCGGSLGPGTKSMLRFRNHTIRNRVPSAPPGPQNTLSAERFPCRRAAPPNRSGCLDAAIGRPMLGPVERTVDSGGRPRRAEAPRWRTESEMGAFFFFPDSFSFAIAFARTPSTSARQASTYPSDRADTHELASDP